MAQKPETVFSSRLHDRRKWNLAIYFEKMSNPWRSGLVDFYYEGTKDILWSEHKWISKPWLKDLASTEICSTKSWIAQRRWLDRAFNNNKHTAVIIGVGSSREVRAYYLEHPYNFIFAQHKLLELDKVRKIIENLVL